MQVPAGPVQGAACVLVVVARQAARVAIRVLGVLLLAEVDVADPAAEVYHMPLLPLGHSVRGVEDELVAAGAARHELFGVAPAAVHLVLVLVVPVFAERAAAVVAGEVVAEEDRVVNELNTLHLR